MTLATEMSGSSLPQPMAASPVALAVGFVSCAALVASIPSLMAVGFDYEKLHSEGYNAYRATRAAAGLKGFLRAEAVTRMSGELCRARDHVIALIPSRGVEGRTDDQPE
jgi:hypothetical protein